MENKQQSNGGSFQVSKGQARYILLICALLYMVNYMDRQVLAVVMEPMMQDLGLCDSQAGIIQTVFLLGMALFSFPAAYLVDRWSRRKALSVMAMIWSLFTWFTGMGRSFWGILFPRAVVGVGEAGFASGGTAMIGAAYPERKRSAVMGLFNVAIPLGSGLGMILGGWVSQSFGDWRAPFLAFAIPGLLLGVLALFMKDYKTAEQIDHTGQKIGFLSSAISLFKIPTLRWLYLGFAMQNIMAFSFLVWMPAYLMRAHGVPEDKAGLTAGLMALMAIVGSPLGGLLADKWHKKNPRGRMLTPALTIFLASIFWIACLAFEVKGVGFIIGICFGTFLVMGIPALSAVSQDVAPPALKSMSWGMNVFCMYAFGGGWAPWAVGAVSDAFGGGAGGLQLALYLTSLGGLMASFLFWFSSRTLDKDRKAVQDMALYNE